MRNAVTTILAAISTMAAPTHAIADPGDWSNEHYDVTALDTGCGLTSTFSFDGRSDVRFSLIYDDDGPVLFLTSSSWTSEAREEYRDFNFYFYEPTASYGDGVTIGYHQNSLSKGFMTAFPEAFLDSLAAARRMVVTRGMGDEQLVVTDLNLDGSGAAVGALRQCVRTVSERNAAQARREARFDHIARDPFAGASESPASSASGGPRWERMPTVEFPERAASRGIAFGSVQLSCDAAGQVPTGCTILSETPSGAGFGQAALSGVRRARFESGISGRQTFTVRFEAPAAEPLPSPE